MVLRVTAATPCTLRGARDLGHVERVTHALAGEGGGNGHWAEDAQGKKRPSVGKVIMRIRGKWMEDIGKLRGDGRAQEVE